LPLLLLAAGAAALAHGLLARNGFRGALAAAMRLADAMTTQLRVTLDALKKPL
jgi:hypothetical protein